jgi:integrase
VHHLKKSPGALCQPVKALREWKETATENDLKVVFCQPGGVPIDRTGIGKYALKPAIEKAKIEKAITPHGLRHKYASMLIDMGKNVVEVAYYRPQPGSAREDLRSLHQEERQEERHG